MTAARGYAAHGIVVRARNLGEADRIITFFTREFGKLDAVAKGVRRAKSRLAGVLQFGDEVQLALHRGRTLDVIVEAQTKRSRWENLVKPQAFATASVVLEVIDAFCEPSHAEPEIFALAGAALNAIARAEQPEELLPRFRIRLLDALGVAPPLDVCIECAKLLGTNAWLDAVRGGLLCGECRPRGGELPELDLADLESLRGLLAPRGDGAALHATAPAARASELLIAHYLGRRPRAESVNLDIVKSAS